MGSINIRDRFQEPKSISHVHVKFHSQKESTTFSQSALAGALAGAVVSCVVHPVDTIKTILQANQNKKQAFTTILETIKHRGIQCLYKGLSANLATAAPISAIYASTYEAVKGFLIPKLSPDWKTVAHCVAGGCASLATAIVYTPSEVVKQRLQLGTEYNSSFAALTGIVRNEGLLSLYSGLPAVLCRNVPQSVIKFWTYEVLKQAALRRQGDDRALDTIPQLAIGGIAGSTAAVFTTPFDVIKTRMQSKNFTMYRNVGEAFVSIWKSEGLSGLYRGLVPRLVIYMSQGAVFFASYEILKIVISKSQEKMKFKEQHLLNKSWKK